MNFFSGLMIISIISLLTATLSGCTKSRHSEASGSIMHGYNVQSGQYYLISNARQPKFGSDTRLFDDPHILYRYRNQVIPVSSLSNVLGIPGPGVYVNVYNRKGELLRASSRNGAIQFPQAMWTTGKPLEYTEEFQHMANARQRMEQLRAIEGITHVEIHDSHYHLPPIAEADYRVTIRFPLWAARADHPHTKLPAERMLAILVDTVEDGLKQMGAKDYYVKAKHVESGKVTGSPGYELRVFALQLLCGPRCYHIFNTIPLSAFLESPVSYQELQDTVKDQLPSIGTEFMFMDLAMMGERQFDLDKLIHPDAYFNGAIDSVPRMHSVFWKLDLEHALSGPLPTELWPPPQETPL